jgi:hypothetical protein
MDGISCCGLALGNNIVTYNYQVLTLGFEGTRVFTLTFCPFFSSLKNIKTRVKKKHMFWTTTWVSGLNDNPLWTLGGGGDQAMATICISRPKWTTLVCIMDDGWWMDDKWFISKHFSFGFQFPYLTMVVNLV